MNATTETKKAVKKNVLTDAYAHCEFNLGYYWPRTVEGRVKALETRINDFNSFIKDHRSQDDISLEIVHVHEDQCSECQNAWEPEVQDGLPTICANCGAEIDDEVKK